MQQIRQTVVDLERNHLKMKDHYEEEIMRLKRELESRPPPQPLQQQQGQQPGVGQPQAPQALLPAGGPPIDQQQPQPGQQPPPSLGRSGTNVFGGIMSGQPGSLPQQPPPGQQPPQQQQQQQPIPPPQVGAAGYPNQPGYPSNGYPPVNQPPGTPGSVPALGAGGPPGGPGMPPLMSPGSKSRADAAAAAASNSTPAPAPPPNNATPGATPVPSVSTPASGAGPTSQSDMNQLQQQAQNLGNIFPDFEKVAPEFKKQKDDWFVMYNDRAPRRLDVDMVQSLEHHSVVCCVRFSADGKYVATGCNRSAQIFDVQTGKLVCKLQDDTAERDGDLYIRSVCFSPDGKYLATGAEDKQIRVWDIKTRQIRYLFQGHDQDIYSLDFARNGRHIASGSGDRTVRMWDMESGQCVLTLSITDGVTTVAISPDGRYVAAGSLDKTVRVWDTSTGFLVERLEAPDGHKDSVYSVAFTPDGKDLVSGSLDKTIKLWELQAPRNIQGTHKGGVCVKTFIGHKDFVLSVASTPDGQWILSGSKDRGVQFWDPRTSQVQLTLQGHKNSVISVAPSPTGGLFATGSGDCKARIWRYFSV